MRSHLLCFNEKFGKSSNILSQEFGFPKKNKDIFQFIQRLALFTVACYSVNLLQKYRHL